MPNIAAALKDEITRLARKEIRAEVERLKKASAQYRADIAELKRRATELEKLLARREKAGAKAVAKPSDEASGIRFSAKGFAKHRARLGLSAAELGGILGVSAQSVYHWEAGKSKPRRSQLAAIAALRRMGKREAKARLAEAKPAEA